MWIATLESHCLHFSSHYDCGVIIYDHRSNVPRVHLLRYWNVFKVLLIPLKRIVLKRTCKCTVEIYIFISFELKPRPQHSDLHVVAAAKVHADVVFDPNNNSLFPKKYFVLNLTEKSKKLDPSKFDDRVFKFGWNCFSFVRMYGWMGGHRRRSQSSQIRIPHCIKY